MGEIEKTKKNAIRRTARARSTLHGTSDRPRLSVHISNRHVAAQVINDDTGTTLASSTTVGSKVTGTLTEQAAAVGTDIAKKAKANKINKVMFDRGGRQYQGRIKALADAARTEGLEF